MDCPAVPQEAARYVEYNSELPSALIFVTKALLPEFTGMICEFNTGRVQGFEGIFG